MIDYLVKLYCRLFLKTLGSFYVPNWGTTIVVVKRVFPSFAWAQALNNVIIVKENLAYEIFNRPEIFCNAIGHELVHVEQARRFGIFKFAVLYLLSSLKSFLSGKHYYWNNSYEEEAYLKQEDFCQRFVKSELDDLKFEIKRILIRG